MPSKRKKSKKKPTKSANKTTRRVKKAAPKKQARPAKKAVKKKKSSKGTSLKATSSRSKTPVRRAKQLGTLGSEVSARQSPDLEGLSRVEQADSESVTELVDEGNVFEAGAVAGVQEADDEDTREVHTREVPEDDVPGEYLDED